MNESHSNAAPDRSYNFCHYRSQYRVLQVLEALSESPSTCDDMAKTILVCRETVVKTLRHMRDMNMVYVKRYKPSRVFRGRPAPVYALGNRPDAPSPRLTKSDHFKRVKANPETHDLYKAKQRARARIREVKKTKATWLTALVTL